MRSRRDSALVPVLLSLGAFIAVVSSLGAPLIPTFARDLDVSLQSAQWALTVTLLVAAVTSPLIGRLGDGRHRNDVILGCLATVAVGSVLSALATTLPVLIAGRALQGVGIALAPLTMAAAREHLTPGRARSTIAALSVVGAAGAGLGYPISGLIAEHFDFSVGFWAACVVALACLAATAIVVPRPAEPPQGRRLDLLGALIIAVGLIGILIAFEKAPDWGWLAGPTVGLIAGGLVLLAVWAWHELRTPDPLVDLRLIRHRAVLTADVTGLALGLTMYASLVIVVQFVQTDDVGLGETIFISGFTLTPLAITSSVSTRALPWLERHVGIRNVIPLGAIVTAAACVFFSLTSTALWQILVMMAFVGLGLGLTFGAMPLLVVTAVPAQETGSALGFYQVSRFVGMSMGSGLGISLIRAFGDHGTPTLHAFRAAELVCAGIALSAAAAAWLLAGAPAREPTPAEQEHAVEEGMIGTAGLEMLEPDDRARV